MCVIGFIYIYEGRTYVLVHEKFATIRSELLPRLMGKMVISIYEVSWEYTIRKGIGMMQSSPLY